MITCVSYTSEALDLKSYFMYLYGMKTNRMTRHKDMTTLTNKVYLAALFNLTLDESIS